MAKISVSQLAKYAADQLEAGAARDSLARNLASYLLENRQSRDLPKIMRAIEAELSRRGVSQVVITSAHEVSDATKHELADLLGASNPVFHTEIDANVIGGVKARSGESEVDLTVRARLNRFKSNIVNSGK